MTRVMAELMTKVMAAFILSFSVVCISSPPANAVDAAGAAVVASVSDGAQLEAFFDQQLDEQMTEHHIPNAVISVVAGGEVILAKGYGLADLEAEQPVDAKSSLFRIGSTSKLFTWTAVMQLVEQGKLDLHTDINTYVDVKIPAQIVTMKNSEPEPITLTHLMTHTAGFEDSSETIFRLEPSSIVPLRHYIHNNVPARVFPPGEVIAYSNFGTALAGYIVEQVSGMPFAQYVERHIYTPLQMRHSTFLQPLPAELSPHMTGAYRYVEGEFLPAQFVYMPESAGGMSSSASDMAQFMLAFLHGGQVNGERILKEETVELMRQQQFTSHPDLHGMAYGFMEGEFNGQHTLFHSGSTMLFDTGFYLLPEEQVGLFISYSGGNFLTHQNIFQAFLDQYYPVDVNEQVQRQSAEAEGAKERAQQFVGEYHQNRKSFTTSEKFISLMMGPIQVKAGDEGDLIVQHMGESNRFVEIEPGTYYNVSETKSPDPFGDFATIIFEQGPLGQMLLLSDGPMSYSKVPWYSTLSMTILMVAVTLLTVIGTLICRAIASSVRWMRRRSLQQTRLAATARWIVTIYGVLALVMVINIGLTGEFDPVYGFSKSTFGVVPAWAPIVELIPALMVVVSLALVVFMIVTWLKRTWHIKGHIHYTLFTAASVILTWLFSFWNLV